MNRLYIFFPHCYIKATSTELLIYDTITFKGVYLKDVVLANHNIDRLNRFGYIEENCDTKFLLQKIATNHFGYYIHPRKKIKDCNFTTEGKEGFRL